MTKTEFDPICAYVLYDMLYGATSVSTYACPTHWTPQRDVFYELVNNFDKYSQHWEPLSRLPDGFTGSVIAKVIKEGQPVITRIYIEDNTVCNKYMFDCVISFLMTIKQWNCMFEKSLNKKKMSDEEIEEMVSVAKESVDGIMIFHATFYKGIQLNDWVDKYSNKRFKDNIVCLNVEPEDFEIRERRELYESEEI